MISKRFLEVLKKSKSEIEFKYYIVRAVHNGDLKEADMLFATWEKLKK